MQCPLSLSTDALSVTPPLSVCEGAVTVPTPHPHPRVYEDTEDQRHTGRSPVLPSRKLSHSVCCLPGRLEATGGWVRSPTGRKGQVMAAETRYEPVSQNNLSSNRGSATAQLGGWANTCAPLSIRVLHKMDLQGLSLCLSYNDKTQCPEWGVQNALH